MSAIITLLEKLTYDAEKNTFSRDEVNEIVRFVNKQWESREFTSVWAKVQRHLARLNEKSSGTATFTAWDGNVMMIKGVGIPMRIFSSFETLESYLDGLEGEK